MKDDDMPLVSIVAINYNNGPWVLDTLNSIAEQTYTNIELIVVDDCSTDNSPELIKEWLKSYTLSFQFIRHEKNKGICAVCNTGFKIAKGKFISYIATDDIMLPEKTSEQADFFQGCSHEVAMLYSDAYLIQENGDPMYGWFIQKYRQDFVYPPSGWILKDLLIGNFIPAMSIFLKKEVLDNVGYFDENLLFEDYDMWLRIAAKYQIVYYKRPLVKYRIRAGSLFNGIKNWNPPLVRILLKHQHRSDVQKKLIQIASNSYYRKDVESLSLLDGLEVKVPVIKQILFLYRFKVPFSIGYRIFSRLLK